MNQHNSPKYFFKLFYNDNQFHTLEILSVITNSFLKPLPTKYKIFDNEEFFNQMFPSLIHSFDSM